MTSSSGTGARGSPRRRTIPGEAVREGELKFRLHGEKLKGRFVLVRTRWRRAARSDWLLIHKRDEDARPRLGRRRAAALGQERPHQRRGQGRRRRRLGQPRAGCQAHIDLAGARAGATARVRAADAGDAGGQAVQRSGLALRGEAGRLPGRGGGRRRQRPPVDAQQAGRGALLPATSPRPSRRGSTPRPAIVDGEVVALDDEGQPGLQPAPGPHRHERLRQRARRAPSARPGGSERGTDEAPAAPARLLPLRPALPRRPVARRRAARGAQEAARASRCATTPRCSTPAHVDGGRPGLLRRRPASRAWRASSPSCGAAGTRPGGAREAGSRSRSGATRNSSSSATSRARARHADLGALLVAVYEGDELRYAGEVGSGLDTRMRADAARRSWTPARGPIRRVPRHPRIRGAHWAEPQLVIRAEFSEWTSDNLLRQAAFKGLESDGSEDRDPRTPGGRRRRWTPPRGRDKKPAAAVEPARPKARGGGRGEAARSRRSRRAEAARRRRRPARSDASAGRSERVEGSHGPVRRRREWRPADPRRRSAIRGGVTAAELAELDAMTSDGLWSIGGVKLKLSNLDKVLFPDARLHQARPDPLLRHDRAGAAAATCGIGRSTWTAGRTASTGGQLLAEADPVARAGVGRALGLPGGGQERVAHLRGRRPRRDAGLARQPGRRSTSTRGPAGCPTGGSRPTR